MITIKALTVHDELHQEEHCTQVRNEDSKNENGKDETGESHSTGSVRSITRDIEKPWVRTDKVGQEVPFENEDQSYASLLAASHPQDSLSNLIYHASPLESIKELDEMDGREEQVSELERSPGDGAVKIKQQDTDDGFPLQSEKERCEVQAGSNPGAVLIGQSVFEDTLESTIMRDENEPLDPTGKDLLQVTPNGEHHQKESHKALVLADDRWERVSSRASDDREIQQEPKEHHQSTEQCGKDDRDGVMECKGDRLSPSEPSIQELQDPELKHESYQSENNRLCNKVKDSKMRIRELENELCTEKRKSESHAHRIRELEMEMSNSSLIGVLTECKTKVEQLEELRYSSRELMIQLQEANRIAACLKQRIFHLEEERMLKQQQLVNLGEELEGSRKALEQKNREMVKVKVQVQALNEELERTQDKKLCPAECLSNGHTVNQPHRRSRNDTNDSKHFSKHKHKQVPYSRPDSCLNLALNLFAGAD
nr:PREDICTED: uncharacterized protein LOC107077436 [Lepisosteus oculatus]